MVIHINWHPSAQHIHDFAVAQRLGDAAGRLSILLDAQQSAEGAGVGAMLIKTAYLGSVLGINPIRLQQRLHDICMPIPCRPHQRRVSLAVLLINIYSGRCCEQGLDDLQVSGSGCCAKGGLSCGCLMVGLRAMGQQCTNHVMLAISRCPHQRSALKLQQSGYDECDAWMGASSSGDGVHLLPACRHPAEGVATAAPAPPDGPQRPPP